MNRSDYVIPYKAVKDLAIGDFLEYVNDLNGKDLRQLRLQDLTSASNHVIYPGEGVYLFREKQRVLYVGKVTAMSFIERIPKHLDPRPYAWMNRLLQLIATDVLKEDKKDPQSLQKACEYAYNNLNLVLINFTEENKRARRTKINRIERLLRASAKPLNKFKGLHIKNPQTTLDDY